MSAAVAADTTDDPVVSPPRLDGAIAVLRRGWAAAPELRRGALVTVLLAFAGAGGRIVVPVLLQLSIDRGFRDGRVDTALIARLAAGAAVIVVIAGVCQRTAVFRLGRSSETALYGLRSRLFAHVHRLSVADQGEERVGALVARVTSDVETLSQFFGWGGIAWLVNSALMVAVAGTMAFYDVRLAAVAIVTSAPVVLLLRAVQRRLVVAYAGVREQVGASLAVGAEVVSGAPVIRAYDAVDATTAKAQVAVHAQRDAQIRASKLASLLFPSGDVVSTITVVVVVLVGLRLGDHGRLTSGALVGFVFLTQRFLEPIAEFTDVIDQTQTAVAGMRRILGLLDTPVEVVDAVDGAELPATPPSIELKHVTFRYRPRAGETQAAIALHDVSVRIEAGQSVAVVGATGSGKTTFARLITRLVDPSEGVVEVAGIDLRTIRNASLRRRLVMVPQEPFLFDTSVADNVRFGRPATSDDDVALAFVELGLEGWAADLPRGLATPVGERGEHLSAGERQLVALARAYVANPTCLVLDEATSAVDPATEARLARALVALSRGRTSVTIAHRLTTAQRADHVLVFAGGRLVEHGPHAELALVDGGHYAALWTSWIQATGGSPNA